MLVSRWNPWNELLSAQSQAEQLFNEAFGRGTLPESVVRTLPLDIRQTDEAFFIEASMPGFTPHDVEISFDENVLTIRGVRPQEDATDRGGYVQRERHLSSVHRHVYLPAQVKADEITAGFNNGILTIVVPREQKAQPMRIPVTVAVGDQPKVIEAAAVASAGV